MGRWEKVGLGILIGLALIIGGAYWYLHSDGFQQRMRAYAAHQIFQTTGATAEIGSFHFAFRPLSIDCRDVVLHGRESSTQEPLARIAHLYIGISLQSLFQRKVQLDQFAIDQPLIHIYILPDGHSNLPIILAEKAENRAAAQGLFDSGISDLRVSNGEVVIGERKLPLNIELHDVSAGLEFRGNGNSRQYDGEVQFSRGTFARVGLPPLIESGDLKFTLWPNDLDIRQFTLSGSGHRLALQVKISDFNRPEIDGSYEVDCDLSQLVSLSKTGLFATQDGGQPTVEGHANVRGLIHIKDSEWATDGSLRAWGVRLPHTAPQLGVVAVEGKFGADASGLIIPALNVSALGGTIRSHGRYQAWETLRAAGTVEGMQIGRLVRATTQPARRSSAAPAIVRKLAGTIHGSFRADAVKNVSRDLNVAFDLAITPPIDASFSPQQRQNVPSNIEPVAGIIRGSVRPFAGIADIQQARLLVPGATLQATGQLGTRGAALRVDLTSSDLGQLQPIVATLFAPAAVPELGGSGGFHGTVVGPFTAPAVAGHVDLSRFQYGDVNADRVVADANIGASALNVSGARFSLGSQQVMASGSVGLHDYRLADSSPLNLRLNAQNFDLAQALRMAGENQPVTGTLNARLAISGTKADPQGRGRLEIRNAKYGDQKIDGATADVTFAHSAVTTHDLALTLANSQITGSASYGLIDHSYNVDVAAHNLNVADIAALQSPRLNLSGSLDLHAQGSGTVDHPAGTLALQTHNLQGGGESLGDLKATVVADGHNATLDAVDVLPGGQLSAKATVGLAAPYVANAQLTLHDYDIDAFLRRFTSAEVTGHSHIGGEIYVRGPLSQPTQLVAEANFDPVQLSIENFTLQNVGAVKATLAHQQLTLYPAHITGNGTDLLISGHTQLAGGRTLAAQATGNVNLAILHTFEPTIHSSGTLVLNARARGTLAQPLVEGTVDIRNAAINQNELPIAFDNIQGTLRFTGDRLDIEKLTATAGGGDLSVAGFAAYSQTGLHTDVSVIGNAVRLRYQGLSATNDLRLRLAGQPGNALLTGDVQVTRISVAPNFDFALFIATRKTVVSLPDPNSPLSHLRLDVHVVTGPQVELATTANVRARLQLHADMRLRGTANNPVLLGRATATQGEITFAGNQYTVTKADMTFANPFRIAPLLDVGLNTTIQQYDITLNITGTTDKLNVTYRSDPPLSDSDILSLLATGQTAESQAAVSEQSTTTFVGQSEQLLRGALDNVVASRLGRLFGITQLQVNQYQGLPGNTTGTAVTVQEQVSKNIKVSYTRNLSQWLQDALEVNWTINRHLGVSLSRDEFGLYGFDFQFRHRAR